MTERSALSFPAFRSIWSANVGANLGAMIQLVGASWLMTALGASPTMVALVQASTSLPFVLIALPAGALADNRDRRSLMIIAQVYLLVISSTLFVLSYLGVTTPWLLLGFTFLIGCGAALNGPVWQASVGDLVSRASLPNAVALNAVSTNVARSLGPAIGGAIVGTAGSPAAFLVSACCTIGLVLVLARWRPVRHPRPLPPERLTDAVAAGLRYAAMSPHLRVALARSALAGFVMCPLPALLPLVARDVLHGGPIVYGVALGSFGVGAVGGALLIKRAQEALRPETIMQASALLTAAGAAAAALSPTILILSPLLTLSGAGWVLAFSTLNVSIQLSSPRWVTARSLAAYHAAVYAGMAAGSWVFGLIAAQVGVSLALGLSACLNTFLLLLTRHMPVREFNTQSLDLSDAWKTPTTAMPIPMRSGPIVISIEHRIADDNVVAFLSVMQERRRIRRRDGALNWTLMRDLGDPQLWVESYRVPTWLDYVRLNSRRTKADEANLVQLRALSLTSDPVVRRMIERSVGSLPSSADESIAGSL